ncbi:YkgJ family cysteine cluster protein [Burkholderia glumae]
MGQARKRGTKEERIAEAKARMEREPDIRGACKADSSGQLMRRMIPIYEELDARMSKSPNHIDCQSGCSYCCYYHVMVTPAEAIALAAHIETLPAHEREPITARLMRTAEHVAPLSQAEYIRTNIPCAFLDAGHCTVYSMRPFACRGFQSMSVKRCKDAFDDPYDDRPHTPDPVREFVKTGYVEAMHASQRLEGCEAATYEMHGAVASALHDSQAIARWRTDQVTFPEVRDRMPA